MAYVTAIVSYHIGYFLIPLCFFIFAILLANSNTIAAWIFFAIGAGFTLLSLIGSTRLYIMQSNQSLTDLMIDWIIFIFIAILTIIVIIKHKKKRELNSIDTASAEKSEVKQEECVIAYVDPELVAEYDKNPTETAVLFCRHCGVEIAPDAEFCHRCGTKVVHVGPEE